MAYQSYYELSAMLRMQLPILLSFAILRCLMGTGAKFWAKRIVPKTLQHRLRPVLDATDHLLTLMHGGLLIIALFYWATRYGEWNTKRPEDVSLVCTEYAVPRVQGIMSAMGLLGLINSSEPFTLGLALTVLMSVSDGSAYGLVLSTFLWRAVAGDYKKHRAVFFTVLLTLNTGYYTLCHSEKHDRARCATLASSFAALTLMWFFGVTSTRAVWAFWLRMRRSLWKRLLRSLDRMLPPPPRDPPNLSEISNSDRGEEDDKKDA